MENINFLITDVTYIIERQNAVGWNVENMSYEKEYTMVIILEGETEYTINGQKYLFKKDDLIIFSPKLLRSGKTMPDHPWSFITIRFNMNLNEHAHHFFNKPLMIRNNVSASYRKLFTEVYRTWISKDPLFKVKCSMLITEIIYKLILSDLPYQNIPNIEKIKKTRLIIQENFRFNISIEELAKSIGMSVSYFRRLFHKVYGYSPMQYIMNLRIEYARDLLLSGEVNVTEAARLSGFDDIYYFSRLFKEKTGTSPSRIQDKM